MHLDPFRMDYTLGCCILYEWLKYELHDGVIMSTLLVDLPFCICGCKDVLEFIIGQDGPVLLMSTKLRILVPKYSLTLSPSLANVSCMVLKCTSLSLGCMISI